MGLFLLVGMGCVAARGNPTPEETLFGSAVMKLADAPVVDRRHQPPPRLDTKQVGAFQEAQSRSRKENQQEESYYLLTARQCQALAAAHAVWGNTLDEESELAAAVVGRGRTPRARAAALQSDLLRYGALAERNRAAAEALQWFYRLAEAEACWELTQTALEAIEKAEGENVGSENLSLEPPGLLKQTYPDGQEPNGPGDRKGSAKPASGRWRDVWNQWRKRQEETARQIEYMNSRLRPMLGAEVGDFRRIWPAVNLIVAPEKVDVDRAVNRGLEERAELRALRRLLRGIDANDLSAVRGALDQMHPALGATPSRFPAIAQALGTAPQHMEAAVREEQIRLLLARREKEVEEEIRQAAREVQQALQKVSQAHEAYQVALQTAKEKTRTGSEAKAQANSDQQTDDQLSAQLALYEAQVELTHQVAAWKIAEVKLLEAMGVLARDSGYPLPEHAWQGIEL